MASCRWRKEGRAGGGTRVRQVCDEDWAALLSRNDSVMSADISAPALAKRSSQAETVYGYRSSWKFHSGPLMHKHDEVHKQLRGKGLKLVCCLVQLDLNDSYWQLCVFVHARARVRAHALMSSATVAVFTLILCFNSTLHSTFLFFILFYFPLSLSLSLSLSLTPPPSTLPHSPGYCLCLPEVNVQRMRHY